MKQATSATWESSKGAEKLVALVEQVKSAVTTRMKRGEYIEPFGLFGYEKSPEDIQKLVIDEICGTAA